MTEQLLGLPTQPIDPASHALASSAPCVARTSERVDLPSRTEAVPRSLRVLVVDDDAAVRAVTTAFLRVDAHTVVEAACGHDALTLFDDSFDLVITDRVMPPGISGDEVAAAIAARRPDVPVLLLTGFGSIMSTSDRPEAIAEVLSKPISLRQLREAVARHVRLS